MEPINGINKIPFMYSVHIYNVRIPGIGIMKSALVEVDEIELINTSH